MIDCGGNALSTTRAQEPHCTYRQHPAQPFEVRLDQPCRNTARVRDEVVPRSTGSRRLRRRRRRWRAAAKLNRVEALCVAAFTHPRTHPLTLTIQRELDFLRLRLLEKIFESILERSGRRGSFLLRRRRRRRGDFGVGTVRKAAAIAIATSAVAVKEEAALARRCTSRVAVCELAAIAVRASSTIKGVAALLPAARL